MAQSINPILTLLLPLLLISFLACADNPTTPELTEEDVARIVAEELAKLDIEETHLSPQEIAQIALKSTVYLSVKTQKKNYYGSGFVVGEGLIATCEHVLEGMISGTAESVFDEKKYPLTEILAVSEKHDLAIVGAQGFTAPALLLGNSDTVRIGDTVYVVGNPDGYVGTFSDGLVSAIRSDGAGWGKGALIQITAPISIGSSGGPVLNSQGEVIGVAMGGDVDGQNLNLRFR